MGASHELDGWIAPNGGMGGGVASTLFPSFLFGTKLKLDACPYPF